MVGTETTILNHEGRLSSLEANVKTTKDNTVKILDSLPTIASDVKLNKQSIKYIWWFVKPLAIGVPVMLIFGVIKYLMK